jgi:antitoxin component HigA of HigAB toxin-antitoxin module
LEEVSVAVHPIHTQADDEAALKVVSALVNADAERGSRWDQLEVLGTLLKAHEAQNYRVNPSPHHE